MTDSNYVKIYTGNFIVVQLIKDRLEAINISPIIKDEAASARLAGFATSNPGLGMPEIFVHENELDTAVQVVESVRAEMETA